MYPGYHAAPVPAFGDDDPRVARSSGSHPACMAPNRTGRPFTGDHAGIVLYATLHAIGVASRARIGFGDDDLRLDGARITNAVKCLPPAEQADAGRGSGELQRLPACRTRGTTVSLRVLLALGRIAHDAILDAAGESRGAFRFAHGAEHRLGDGRWLIDSYHCSRYNTRPGG
jgi:uracil-DNA glycosylase